MAEVRHILKLKPELVTKPWGLKRETVLDGRSFDAGVGELWLASAQTGAGNYSNTVVEPPLQKPLAQVLQDAAAAGDAELEALVGERAFAALKDNPHRGKTEAWHIRQADGWTGAAAGPRTAQHRERLRDLVLRQELGPDIGDWPGEVRETFGLIEPLRGGEVFLVPCGTLHTIFAVGPDSRLILDEIQQGYGTSPLPTLSKIIMVQDSLLSVQVHPCDDTVKRIAAGEMSVEQDLEANPTVRLYDFGRRPGIHPELGLELTDVDAGARRVPPVRAPLEGGGQLEILVACRHFVKSRLALPAGTTVRLQPAYGSYRVLYVTDGAAELEAGGQNLTLAAGEVCFVPGTLERELTITARGECRLFDDSVPDLQALRGFLSAAGVSAQQQRALLDPPRARSASE